MRTTELERALTELGVGCAVEEQGKLAVIVLPTTEGAMARRREIVVAARAHGFTNVCLEISPV